MRIWKLAFLECIRKKWKNLILVLVLLVAFTCIFISLQLYSSTTAATSRIYDEVGSYIELAQSDEASDDELEVTLPDEVIEQILALDHVIGVNEQIVDYVTPVDFFNTKTHTGQTPTSDFDSGTDLSADAVIIDANLDISQVDIFRQGQATVIEGQMPDSDTPGLLMEKTLAEESGLGVGDSVTVESVYYGTKITAEIVGIYETTAYFEITEYNEIGTAVYAMSPYNRIYSNIELGEELFGKDRFERGLQIFIDSQENINSVGRTIKSFDLDWDIYSLYNMTETYAQMNASNILALSNYSKLILIFVVIVALIILSILFTVFSRYYIYDGALMLSMGMGKKKIVGYYFLSMLYITAVAFVLALAISAVVSPIIVGGGLETAEVVASGVSSYETGLDTDFSISLEPVSSLYYLIMGGIALLFMVFAALSAAFHIIRYQPRKVMEGGQK